ncbi:LuxR C-terminal-related transcriptional regulator [Synechocystis sp. PCC 7509]|uniref:LuxR C-terminal-related transcriptional regulator n=1 Tax=Synechocystis sp. PCC 7509 TaxID=927677 RepID=UPI0002ABDA36|nr:LuxR C-terminal-related transcriptional regulator [Synechocystis sp. PCC 7509]
MRLDILFSSLMHGLLDSTRILFDLQQANKIAQSLSGCLELEEIAHRVTDGLVEKFDQCLARLWLVEPDQTSLKLIASAGMYRHTNGFFSRVPMGAFKVGKIAQNHVSFLSNNLAGEPWVGNKEWARSNNIHGFAGYPLIINDKAIGVLAVFSNQALELEFLEVLQTLCTITAVALDTAMQYQKIKQSWQANDNTSNLSLCDRLVTILSTTRLTLIGTEKPLNLPLSYVFLQTAEILKHLECNSCRLIYGEDTASLEAIFPIKSAFSPQTWIELCLNELCFIAAYLGGSLHQASIDGRAMQVVLKLPYSGEVLKQQLQIKCRSPILQLAFTHLCVLAGLTIGDCENLPLLTDDITKIQTAKSVIWIEQKDRIPQGITAKVNLSTTPEQLRCCVESVVSGQSWGIEAEGIKQNLSDRELEILTLLTQGKRDRDIAQDLIISESTVKFHMNNVLTKLKAKTRCQAIACAIINGLI